MRTVLIAALALALAGCASMPVQRPQTHIVPKVVREHKADKEAPKAIAAPLTTPKWYDRFRHSNGKFWH